MSIHKMTAAARRRGRARPVSLAACGSSDPTTGEKPASPTRSPSGRRSSPRTRSSPRSTPRPWRPRASRSRRSSTSVPVRSTSRRSKNGEIDLLPEYTGNLLTYLDPKATATAPERHRGRLDEAFRTASRCSTRPRPRTRTRSTSRRSSPTENNVKTIADLKKRQGLRSAANPEFKQRAYGIPGLEKVYGITGIKFTPISDGGGPGDAQGAGRRQGRRRRHLLDDAVDRGEQARDARGSRRTSSPRSTSSR